MATGGEQAADEEMAMSPGAGQALAESAGGVHEEGGMGASAEAKAELGDDRQGGAAGPVSASHAGPGPSPSSRNGEGEGAAQAKEEGPSWQEGAPGAAPGAGRDASGAAAGTPGGRRDAGDPGDGGALPPGIDYCRGPYCVREKSLLDQEEAGNLEFVCCRNDGVEQHMIWLVGLKNIFSRQLPNMPKEYIVRLVLDRTHKSMMIVKSGAVVGGITYRPYLKEGFGEIAFCAITATEQVRGYGTRLMNHLKRHARDVDRLRFFLTYADNNAVGYFRKQGFTSQLTMPRDIWEGFIKDYDGGTLMECKMEPVIPYTALPHVLRAQSDAVGAKIQSLTGASLRLHAPLPIDKDEWGVPTWRPRCLSEIPGFGGKRRRVRGAPGGGPGQALVGGGRQGLLGGVGRVVKKRRTGLSDAAAAKADKAEAPVPVAKAEKQEDGVAQGRGEKDEGLGVAAAKEEEGEGEEEEGEEGEGDGKEEGEEEEAADVLPLPNSGANRVRLAPGVLPPHLCSSSPAAAAAAAGAGPPTHEQLCYILHLLIKAVADHADSWPFREPVDPALVSDYYDVIANPIDLKTMEMRVLSSEHYGRPFYLTLHMFVADMRRMFGNARTYNAPDTIYFKAANRLEAFFVARLKAVLSSQHSLPSNSPSPASHVGASPMQL